MDRLAHAVILAWGWRRRGFAFGAGALSTLAMPPFFLFPILWLSLPILVWLIDGAVAEAPSGRVRRFGPAFAVGWWFGFGYFLAGLWWVATAFFVDADQFGWLALPAVLLLPAGLALFWGVGAAMAQRLWSEDWRRVFALAAGLGIAEWLRGHVLTGFPWNAIGYSLTAGEVLMQSASLLGIAALNVAAVAIFAAPAVLAPAEPGRRRNLALPALALISVAGLGLYGVLRLSQADAAFVPGVTLRIVQPALPQLQKWNASMREETLSTYARMSAPEGAPLKPGMLLVWPESAFPYPLTQDPVGVYAFGGLLPPGTTLLTGAYREEFLPSEQSQFYNTLYMIGDDGTILDAYDKVHLVPFGEYTPGAEYLAPLGIRQLTQSSFAPGPRRRLMTLPSGMSFVPLICYEAVFSGDVLAERDERDIRPHFLLNVTNDGWFGRTTGPYQHFHQARIRSVEEGLPLVRAANTGISAVVDAFGRSIAQTKLGEATLIEAELPVSIAPTFYARWRGLIFLTALMFCMVAGATRIFTPRFAYD